MEISKKPARPRREYAGKPSDRQQSRAGRRGNESRSSRGQRNAEDNQERKFTGEHKSFGGEHKNFGERRKSSFSKDGRFSKPHTFKKKTENEVPAVKANPEEERLNKFIANSGVCSRREADRLIQAGVVTVNGVVVTELGTKINPRKDTILFGDQRLKGEEKVYILMNKPKGFVTTTSDPHAEQTVMDLLTKCPNRVFPVGRLDKNTTGILLFTNDGELSEKLTHPSYNKKKIYEATLDKDLAKEDFDKILSGIVLEDGPINADDLHYVDAEDKRKIGIEIHSGKNRIVRRIFESLGYQVKALDRVYFAGLTKKGLKRGQWRYLTEGEAGLLKMGADN